MKDGRIEFSGRPLSNCTGNKNQKPKKKRLIFISDEILRVASILNCSHWK
jgi:hypothetical protein